MTVPAAPSTTCQVTWLEGGILVSDGLPTVAVGFFYGKSYPPLIQMVSLCSDHYAQLSLRHTDTGTWAFSPVPISSNIAISNPDVKANPRLDHEMTLTPSAR